MKLTDTEFIPDWANLTAERLAHTARVAELAMFWANELEIGDSERARWLRAIGLHDVFKDTPAQTLLEIVPDSWGMGELLHGPAAAKMAVENGENDPGVLDAVKYHSVGYAGWERVGKILFMADYLEPGREYFSERHSVLVRQLSTDFDGVLKAVTAERLAFVIAHQYPILPESAAFWNSLVRES